MEITVVGAGPAGLLTSHYLNKAGYNVEIIEEHKSVGKPVSCSGLIGRDFFEHFKEFDFKDSIKNRIDGAKIFCGNESFELNRKSVSFVVDRSLFDQSLSRELEVSFGERFQSFDRNKEMISIKTNMRRFNTDLLIGSDGPSSRIRTQEFDYKLRYYKGYQVRIKADLNLDNFVQVYLEKPFFTWIIPEGDGIYRMGTVSDNPKESIRKFIFEKSIKGEVIEVQAGVIPVGRGDVYKDRIFLLGDAACQVKPLSGGGVYYGALASEFLAKSIISGNYIDYPLMCKKLLGKEISRGLFMRKIYENLNENELQNIFDFLRSKKQILDESGSFDQHAKTIFSLIKDPKVIKFAPILLNAYIRSL
ncbi:MAG: Digeranylgeranylglycerophospholipid reductase [Candidatus Methanofastidiosum methylothiophilum]|uniref:Digeranylgeranylglycerophospholipid reductase n=1 Tax=Candidatus Methanofastidiosum methylothiophilum TaxID=1705564 RepID=A0A150INI1_9EURY|nr:MAG: Digeranylgeranylglycerophospholipid reductase [Candidatus Methanofastidiosum methylthiophilus]